MYQSQRYRTSTNLLAVTLAVCAAAAGMSAQSQSASQVDVQGNPSSTTNPFFGSVTTHGVSDQTLRITLDDAIRRGLETNLGLKESEANERAVKGQRLEAMQLFLPSIRLEGTTAFHQVNLAAMGFGSAFLARLGLPLNTPYITRADVNQGRIVYSQTLFSGPVIDAFKGVRALQRSAESSRRGARGEVVEQVATAYLGALAASSHVANAQALERADRVLFDQAHAKHEAGVVANLDELRARVQLQTQQQQVIAAENTWAKDLILLKREIGLDAGQSVELVDPTPYSELAVLAPEEVRDEAYRNRQDYQSLKAQLDEAQAETSGYKHQRWPTLSFNGDYAVTAVNGAGTHGNFAVMGRLSFPIFREAALRGDIRVAQAKLSTTNARLADMTAQIDQQVRTSLLDTDATRELVRVARSNVDLAEQALTDETERVNAGIDDNLPLVQAQSVVAAALTNLVESLYQYNLAKLKLARATGVIEEQYRTYVGR